jgi:hypothetical protein
VLPLRDLETMVEIEVDTNSTVMFPAPLMSTIEEIGTFLMCGSVSSSRGIGACARLEQVLFELVAGFHPELAKRLA